MRASASTSRVSIAVAVGVRPVGEADGGLERGDAGAAARRRRRPRRRPRSIAWIDGASAARAPRAAAPASPAGPARRAAHRARARPTADQAANWRSAAVVVAGQAVEPDQQRLVVLVQRAHHGGPDGQVARAVELPAGEVAQRRLVQDRLGGRREPSSLGQQPGLEGVGVLDGEAVEQVGAQARGARRRAVQWPWTSTSTSTVVPAGSVSRTGSPSSTAAGPSPRRISARHHRRAPQGVVGLGEEERRELAARRRALAQQQERQQRPALAAAVAVAGGAVDLDAGPAEQLDRQ